MRQGAYNNEALDAYNKITNHQNIYTENKIYFNEVYKIYYYINQKGYLHLLEFNKCNDYYIIYDNYLTKTNSIKNSCQRGGIYNCLDDAIKSLQL